MQKEVPGEVAPLEEAPEARLEGEFPEEPPPAGVAEPAGAQRAWAEVARQIMQELARPESPASTPEELGVGIESIGQAETSVLGELPQREGAAVAWEVLAAEQQESTLEEAGEGLPSAQRQAAVAAEREITGLEPHPAVAPPRRSRRRLRRASREAAPDVSAVEATKVLEGVPTLSDEASETAPQPEPLGAQAEEPAAAPVEEESIAGMPDEPETLPVDGSLAEAGEPGDAGEPVDEAGTAGNTVRRYPRRPVRRNREPRLAVNSAAQGTVSDSED
jgi:hypothetical protein